MTPIQGRDGKREVLQRAEGRCEREPELDPHAGRNRLLCGFKTGLTGAGKINDIFPWLNLSFLSVDGTGTPHWAAPFAQLNTFKLMAFTVMSLRSQCKLFLGAKFASPCFYGNPDFTSSICFLTTRWSQMRHRDSL